MPAVPAPIPADEDARLAALRRYGILDTPAESAYDDVIAIASAVCGTPIALVSLVDEARQWFKARVGIADAETIREKSFCAHAILHRELMEVPDTLDDPRFATNPSVEGDPYLRFYAGAPLTTLDGYALGTLCVADRVPRRLSPVQRDALQALSRQVVRLFETRRVSASLTEVVSTLEEFASRASHDIKSPLTAVVGYADLLTRRGADLPWEEVAPMLDHIREAGHRATYTVDALLEQARATAGGADIRTDDPETVVRECLDDLRLPDAQYRLEGEWAPVALSAVDLRCVVENLATNAGHYGRSPDGCLRLTVAAEHGENAVTLRFADSGSGIPANLRSTLFEPFVHGEDSLTSNPRSTGLGLALVRRVVRAAGGEVELGDGPGATFVMTLPLAD
jgi:signal transduction histidine kinase